MVVDLLLNIFGSTERTNPIYQWEDIDGTPMLVARHRTIKRNSAGIIIDVQDKVVYHLPIELC